jgi:uncharacterized coiled-coil protein SlyX
MDNNFESSWAYDFEPAPLSTLPSAVPVCLDVDMESFGDSTAADSPPQMKDTVKAESDESFWRYEDTAPAAQATSSSDHESEIDSHSSARVADVPADPAVEEKLTKKFEPVIFESAPAAPAAPVKEAARSTRKRAVRAVAARSRAAAAAAAATGSSPSSDDDVTPTCKRERNKQSAAKYRKRRKMYVVELEAKVAQLEARVSEQTSSLTGLQSENKAMKEQVTFLKKMLNIRNELPAVLPSAKKGAVVFALFSFFLLTACPLWELREPAAQGGADAFTFSHGASASVPVRYSNGRALLSLEDRDLECTVTPRSSPIAAPSSPANFTVAPLQSLSAAFADLRFEPATFVSASA